MRKGRRQSPLGTLEPAKNRPSASPWAFSQVSPGCLLRPCCRQEPTQLDHLTPCLIPCWLFHVALQRGVPFLASSRIRTLSSTQMIFPVFIFLCLSCVTRLSLLCGLYSRVRARPVMQSQPVMSLYISSTNPRGHYSVNAHMACQVTDSLREQPHCLSRLLCTQVLAYSRGSLPMHAWQYLNGSVTSGSPIPRI